MVIPSGHRRMPHSDKQLPEHGRSRRARSALHRATATAAWALRWEGRAFGFAALAVAAAVCLGLLLWPSIGLENIGLIFLTAIVVIAARFGLGPSLFATLLASLCYNFFFTAPYYTLTIDEPANIVAVVVFTIVAVIVSNVAARARLQAVAAT